MELWAPPKSISAMTWRTRRIQALSPGPVTGQDRVHLDPRSVALSAGRAAGRCTRTPAAAQEEGPDERIQVAVQNALRVAALEPGAMVLDEGVRLQDVGADLAAEIDVLLRPLLHRALLVTLAALHVVQARPEDFHGHVAVPVLRSL